MAKFSQSYELGTKSQVQEHRYLEKSLLDIFITIFKSKKKPSDAHTAFWQGSQTGDVVKYIQFTLKFKTYSYFTKTY